MARWLSSLLLLFIGVAGGYLIGHRAGKEGIFQSVPVGFNVTNYSQVTNPSAMNWPCTNPVNGGCAQTVSIDVILKTGSAPTVAPCGGACIQFSGTAPATALAATGSDNGAPTPCWDPTPVYAAGTVTFNGLSKPGGPGTTH
jgi:hypothetical protein